MADETISTKIVANADFSGLIADVHKVTASLSKLQEKLASSNKMMANQIAVMNRSFSDTLRSTGQFSTHFVSLTSDVEKFGRNLDGGKLKLNQYFNAFRDQTKTSGGLIRDLAKQQVALQNSVLQPLGRNAQGLMQFNVQVPRGLDTVKNAAALARTELQIMNKVVQDGAGQIINFGKNTQWTGRQLTVGLTVPLVAFGNAAAKAFREADQELVRLTKVYGDVAGTSAAELGKVRDDVVQTAKEISQAMGVSFKETIGLAADIAATGKTGDELLGSVRETTRLAVLGEVDRQEAMKATLAIQSAFKSNTDELAESINFLNAVENQTSTTLNDLVEAIPKAGPIVKGLGGDVQDLALYLTAMREGGINASEGANALKSALASLINPTDVAVKKFEGLGIDLLGVVNNNAGDLTGTLMALQGALDNLDPLQKQQAIEQLFGKFQFSRLNALFENLGREGSQTLKVLDLMKQSTEGLAQVADRELTAVTESASGKYRRALEGLKASLAEVGEQFLQINTVLITVIDKIVQFAMNLPGPVKQILALLGGVTAIAGPLIMLTGLLANFFGNMAKGVFHIKAFLKGGEGFKYLTPEMLAAEKAGKLVEESFYSDAKAAAVLQQALRNLLDEFSLLEAKAKSGAIAVNPAVSTMAGNLVMASGGRVVDPSNPLVGKMGTRASSHMVPRSGMTDEQRMQQTMFGMVPGSIPVNQKIGQNPQIYMNDDLPDVPGLTKIGGVSTGIVAGEAAKHHAMMATLAMQSKAEIEALKQQMVATGVLSKDFMNQFDDILPIVSRLTDNAARESALIVSELRAGKINVEQARAKIIALNLETERMISTSMQAQATSMGRTLNPTIVPTLNQPVVDATGKSNMRELFKKGGTRDFINRVAGALGVRTSGAGYNIETTKPRRLAMGTVGVQKYANGYTSVAAAIKAAKMLRAFSKQGGMIGGLRKVNSRSNRVGGEDGLDKNFGQIYRRSSSVYKDPEFQAYGIKPTSPGDYLVHGMTPGFRKRTAGLESKGSSAVLGRDRYDEFNLKMDPETLANNSSLQLLPTQFIKNTSGFNTALSRGGNAAAKWREVAGEDMVSLLMFLKSQGIPPAAAKDIADKAARVLNHKIANHRGPITEDVFGKFLNNASVRAIQSGAKPRMVRKTNQFGSDAHSRNLGLSQIDLKENTPFGEIGFKDGVTNLPGYGGGDSIPALLEPGESVVTKTATRGNAGTLALMNKGYPIDSILGFEDGVVEAGTPKRGGMIRGMVAGSAVGFGGQMLGQKVGGPVGTAIQVASMIASMGMGFGAGSGKGGGMMSRGMDKTFGAENAAKLKAPIGPLSGIATASKNAASGLTGIMRIFGPLLKGFATLLKLTSPLGLAITGLTAGIGLFVKIKREQAKALETGRLAYGLDAEAAEKAGFKYTDYNAKIKTAIEDAKALKERNMMVYESMTRANVPMTMTIEQYKKLKEQVKSTMGSYIDLFSQTDKKDVGTVAVQLKAQFMAAGDSAEVAAAKIFTMIKQSENANMAAQAISTNAFQSIQNMEQASAQTVKTFEAAMKTGDAESQARALHSTFMAMDSTLESTIEKQKALGASGKASAEEVGKAIEQKLDSINKSFGTQANLSKDVIGEIGKTDPLLAQMLNSTDTLSSAWAKYRLILQGVSTDLENMSGEAAIAALSLNEIVKSQVQLSPSIVAANKNYKGMTDRIKELEKAQKGQSVKAQYNAKEESARLQKQIEEIKKAAQEKIEGIRKATDAENTQLEIQKAQLRAQQQLIQGNMSAYAEEQMTIEQLMNEANRKDAEEAIIAKAEIDVKPLQDALDNMAKNNDALAKKSALAGESLTGLRAKADDYNTKLGEYTTNLNTTMFKYLTDINFKNTKEYQAALSGLDELGKKLGIKTPAKDVVSELTNALKNGINAQNVMIYAEKIQEGQRKDYTNNAAAMKATIQRGGGDVTKIYDPSTQELTSQARSALIKGDELMPGDVFTDSQGRPYKVTRKFGPGHGAESTGERTVIPTPVMTAGRSLGGPVVAGQKYMVNDRVNPLGYQGEGFVPNISGTIYPNIATMPRYDVGSKTQMSGVNISNSPSSNNVYNIDIALNGTTVTADDVMRSFKRELALVNAKEGIDRKFGGSY
jgi:TP901 family phage tail tape measure protein